MIFSDKMANQKNGLTDTQQAILMLVAFVLVPIIAWLSIGAPTTHIALAALCASILAGFVLFIKEYYGISVPTATPSTPTASTPQKATKTPTSFFRQKRRLIFLQFRK